MPYNPKSGADLRARYNPSTRQWYVEQVYIRTAPGTTDPNDLAGVVGLGEEFWEPRVICTTLFETCTRLLTIAYEENVKIRDFDLGSQTPTSFETSRARTALARLLQ